MVQRRTVKVEANDRVFTVGKTGSGKTFFNEYLTGDIARLIALDPKPSLKKWEDLETVTSVDSASIRALMRGENRRVRVPGNGRFEAWIPWLDLIWRMGNVTCYADEINLIVPPKRTIFEWNRLYQQGRERGIGMWASTQRPVDVPKVSITEADWVFMFMLKNRADRKRVADDSGFDELNVPIRDAHGFYTVNARWERPIYQPILVKQEVQAKPTSTTLKLEPSRRVS